VSKPQPAATQLGNTKVYDDSSHLYTLVLPLISKPSLQINSQEVLDVKLDLVHESGDQYPLAMLGRGSHTRGALQYGSFTGLALPSIIQITGSATDGSYPFTQVR
jgi:hypothetical protein